MNFLANIVRGAWDFLTFGGNPVLSVAWPAVAVIVVVIIVLVERSVNR